MKKILFLSLGVFLMAACGNDNNAEQTDSAPTLLDSINAIEQAVGNPGTVYTADTAEMLVNLYNRFVNEFPEDSLTPIFMMRTAEIEINRGYLEKGIAIFDTILDKYTPGGFEGYADCMYMKAVYLDRDAENCDQAVAAYNAFIETFPDHYLVPDAKNSMKLSQKSQQELLSTVHQWEKKNK